MTKRTSLDTVAAAALVSGAVLVASTSLAPAQNASSPFYPGRLNMGDNNGLNHGGNMTGNVYRNPTGMGVYNGHTTGTPSTARR